MKRLLLVLMLLCVFIPVNAKGTAFVYKMKETDTGLESNDGGSSWEKYKKNHTGYIIVEPGDNNTASVWPINTWTAKDENGTKQKYYEQQDMMTFGFLQVLVGRNTVWIMTYADDVNGGESFMFSGRAKLVNIATPKPSIAATLTGTMIWLDEEDTYIDVGSGKMSMSLDTLLTTYGYTHTGEETLAYVISYLENTLHYLPGTE
jgi:hypothetical protein